MHSYVEDMEDTKTCAQSTATSSVAVGTLENFGYAESYRRVVKTLGSFCIVISLTSPLIAILITAFYQVGYGGYFGLTWGWIIPSIIFFPQALAIAELCSSMPVNGACYWWTAALAPPRWSRPLAFISGWTNVLALFTSLASFSYATSASLRAAIAVLEPNWVASDAQLMGMSFAMVFLWTCLAFLKLENITIIYIGCSVLILIHALIYIIGLPISHAVQHIPFATGQKVFGSYTNYSDWDTGVAVPFTWFAAVWVNSAWAAPAYVVEGTKNPSRSAPKAILTSYILTAVLGLMICVITAFCISDMDAIATDPTEYPLYTLVYSHWGIIPTSVWLIIIAVVAMVGGSASLVTFSFQMAAFARDRGLPFSDFLSHVNPRTSLPINAICVMASGGFLVLLFALSTVAKAIIYSLAVMAILITQSLPMFLRLTAGDRWVAGKFNMGKLSKPCFAWALGSQIYLMVMEAFPSTKNYTASTFNYNWVVALSVIVAATLAYAVIGSKFKGIDLEAVQEFQRVAHAPDHVAEDTISSV